MSSPSISKTQSTSVPPDTHSLALPSVMVMSFPSPSLPPAANNTPDAVGAHPALNPQRQQDTRPDSHDPYIHENGDAANYPNAPRAKMTDGDTLAPVAVSPPPTHAETNTNNVHVKGIVQNTPDTVTVTGDTFTAAAIATNSSASAPHIIVVPGSTTTVATATSAPVAATAKSLSTLTTPLGTPAPRNDMSASELNTLLLPLSLPTSAPAKPLFLSSYATQLSSSSSSSASSPSSSPSSSSSLALPSYFLPSTTTLPAAPSTPATTTTTSSSHSRPTRSTMHTTPIDIPVAPDTIASYAFSPKALERMSDLPPDERKKYAARLLKQREYARQWRAKSQGTIEKGQEVSPAKRGRPRKSVPGMRTDSAVQVGGGNDDAAANAAGPVPDADDTDVRVRASAEVDADVPIQPPAKKRRGRPPGTDKKSRSVEPVMVLTTEQTDRPGSTQVAAVAPLQRRQPPKHAAVALSATRIMRLDRVGDDDLAKDAPSIPLTLPLSPAAAATATAATAGTDGGSGGDLAGQVNRAQAHEKKMSSGVAADEICGDGHGVGYELKSEEYTASGQHDHAATREHTGSNNTNAAGYSVDDDSDIDDDEEFLILEDEPVLSHVTTSNTHPIPSRHTTTITATTASAATTAADCDTSLMPIPTSSTNQSQATIATPYSLPFVLSTFLPKPPAPNERNSGRARARPQSPPSVAPLPSPRSASSLPLHDSSGSLDDSPGDDDIMVDIVPTQTAARAGTATTSNAAPSLSTPVLMDFEDARANVRGAGGTSASLVDNMLPLQTEPDPLVSLSRTLQSLIRSEAGVNARGGGRGRGRGRSKGQDQGQGRGRSRGRGGGGKGISGGVRAKMEDQHTYALQDASDMFDTEENIADVMIDATPPAAVLAADAEVAADQGVGNPPKVPFVADEITAVAAVTDFAPIAVRRSQRVSTAFVEFDLTGDDKENDAVVDAITTSCRTRVASDAIAAIADMSEVISSTAVSPHARVADTKDTKVRVTGGATMSFLDVWREKKQRMSSLVERSAVEIDAVINELRRQEEQSRARLADLRQAYNDVMAAILEQYHALQAAPHPSAVKAHKVDALKMMLQQKQALCAAEVRRLKDSARRRQAVLRALSDCDGK